MDNSVFGLAEHLGEGVRCLDQEHDEMMSLAQRMLRLRKGGDLPGALAALGELLRHSEAHWRREEEMLRRYGYPEADGHASAHHAAARRLAALFDAPGPDAGVAAVDAITRLLLDDVRWKWWFADRGMKPVFADAV